MLVLRYRLLRSQLYLVRSGNDYKVRYLSQTALQFDHVKHDEGKPKGLTEEMLENAMHGSQEANMTEMSELEVSPNTLKEASPPSESVSVVEQVEKRVSKPNNLPTSKETEELRWHDIKHFEFPYKRIMPATFVKTSTLAHGLERVLFNPGVHVLQDQRSKVFNFTPFLQNITQPKDFDYDALAPYITSSRDKSLREMANQHGKRYVGSTSSISAVLSQIYFMLSNFKKVNTSHLSSDFQKESKKFTRGVRTPASIFLRYQNGVYAIDADKSHDVQDGILSVLGKSMEKVLTLPPGEYEKYLKDSSEKISEEEKQKPESYAYGQIGKFLLRSQLDCFHPKLPKKVFDLKTRAVIPIRMDQANYTNYVGYSLVKQQGMLESFEREYYDMIRAAFLNFQARIGHMDGIFVAYHNTSKVFGFQYIPLEEIDSRLFGNTATGSTAFRHTVSLMEKILDIATKKHPEQSLRLSFHARQTKDESRSWLNVFTEVVPPEVFQDDSKLESHVLQPYDSLTKYVVRTKSYIDGVITKGDVQLDPRGHQKWDIEYSIVEDLSKPSMIEQQFRFLRKTQAMTFGPNNKAGASTYMKRFQEISDRYLRLEKMEHRQQLLRDLRSHRLDIVLKAWKELRSNEKFRSVQLKYISRRVVDALDDNEFEVLTKQYDLKGGRSELQQLAAESRASFLHECLKDPISKASIKSLRKASHGLGLNIFLPRERLQKQLEEVETEGGKITKVDSDQVNVSVQHDERGKEQEPESSNTASPPPSKPSFLQRLKAFARSNTSET